MRLAFRQLVAALLMVAAGSVGASGSTAVPDVSLVPPQDRRGTEQTLLTYPEWFLVHSPVEYARLTQTRPPQDFPFLGHIGLLWSSYATVTREQLRDDYPINPGYHVMIWVIATSTTIEYALRAAYENTVGRVSWALAGNRQTAEDLYAARAAQDYVDFIRQEPWYLFDFGSRLKHLWTDVPLWGPGLTRKWERRYALTTEYAVKAVYGKLIEKATRATYTPAKMRTDVVVDRLPAGWAPPPEVSVLERHADGRVLLSLPRYFDFRIAATALAKQGIRINDVAGNQSVILVTLWIDRNVAVGPAIGHVLFEQSLSSPSSMRRAALLIPVNTLSTFLSTADAHGWTVEHVYDY
ncbi:hypothetical protein PQR66_09545 [Paraburkholderia agricolaris]|jgi:hypothetical protein|uniref:Uncharacterized protein n=1 Tax=Paraburkholderia agricolaris TaxID=2152888 RepID=A0ABW8ZK77_9BURK